VPDGTPADWLQAADADEVHLAFPREVYEDLLSVLFPDEGHPFHGMNERGAFAVLAKSTGASRVTYIVEDVVHPESSDDLSLNRGSTSDDSVGESTRGGFIGSLFGGNSDSDIATSDSMLGYQFSEDYHERAIERAQERGGGLLRVHTQPGGVTASSIDTESAARVYKADASRLPPDAPFGAAITNSDDDWTMRVYEPTRDSDDPTVTHTDAVRIVGPTHDRPPFEKRPTGSGSTAGNAVNAQEQDSTIQLWGADGQAVLGELTVGVVGCGGVGSILAEDLARLGVGELVFVDFDRLERANFNRAQGAKRIEVEQERLKTRVAERVAQESATAESLATRVVDGSVVENDPEYMAVPDLLDCDIILSGVDAARPRQVLGALARAHCIPVIDGGSRLHADEDSVLEPEAKVETAVAGPGWPCFECQRVWRQDDVDWESDHPEFRGERGYVDGGVDPDEEDRDPSVIGVNCIVAGFMQRRLFGVVLGVVDGVEPTLRLRLRDVEANWSTEWGCEPNCGAPRVGVGDREQLPTGTDWAMRYERDDIEMPELKTRDASDLVDDDLLGE